MRCEQELRRSACWRAIEARDREFDRVFVYGVLSTGIYCLPSCPSRRPKRDRVVFFRSSAMAQESGFRPCRRCNPEGDRRPNRGVRRAEDVCRYLEAHAGERITLRQLGAQFGANPFHLQRTFKQVMGISPREYAGARRMSAVKKSLRNGKPVAEALYQAGFGSASRLYERAFLHLGMTPATYRKGGSGMKIDYTLVAGPLDWVLVGYT
ncbi:MAG: bifunctional transcriptional activator/DNA repair enzyme AdaA, partial [Terriglobia bacterium]